MGELMKQRGTSMGQHIAHETKSHQYGPAHKAKNHQDGLNLQLAREEQNRQITLASNQQVLWQVMADSFFFDWYLTIPSVSNALVFLNSNVLNV